MAVKNLAEYKGIHVLTQFRSLSMHKYLIYYSDTYTVLMFV